MPTRPAICNRLASAIVFAYIIFNRMISAKAGKELNMMEFEPASVIKSDHSAHWVTPTAREHVLMLDNIISIK